MSKARKRGKMTQDFESEVDYIGDLMVILARLPQDEYDTILEGASTLREFLTSNKETP